MANPVQENVQKLFDSRAKAKTVLNKYQKSVTEAVNNADKRVRVEQLVTSCEEAMIKAFAKKEQLLELAKKTNNPATVTADLEKWLNDTTVQNDAVLRSAREYIYRCPKTDNSSQTSVKAATVKTKSSKASSSKVSKTSSQRQRDLLMAKHRREEVERQNEAIYDWLSRSKSWNLNNCMKRTANHSQRRILLNLNFKRTHLKLTKMLMKLFRG